MSLLIDVETVTAVLLADGWHDVIPGTFYLDAYEFVSSDQSETLHRGGQSGVSATGFSFSDGLRTTISGPLTAVLAVRNLNAN